MADNKKVTQITSMKDDFSRWYTDVILKTEMVDYAPVKGCMVIRPYAYAIWENIQAALDAEFKRTGHQNMYFPLLIPESYLNKEKEHVEGFSPEVAWVTHGGGEELSERLAIRPTSETIICSMYAKWLHSYRDLPFLYNQWANVVRWEKTTRPFLRTSEFLWQEGHTVHETFDEAQKETIQMLEVYQKVVEETLAIPVIAGRKSDKEKFAGAFATYSIEALMHDGQALQSGTSHNLSDHFAKAFGIKFLNRDNREQYAYSTSWGVSTRLMGGLIMVHGDDSGLKIPPKIAPIQIVIIPVASHKEGVMEAASKLAQELSASFRVKFDDNNENSPGWKYAEYEMKGVPIRIEVGPKEAETQSFVCVRRDTGEKKTLQMINAKASMESLLAEIQQNMFALAKNDMLKKTSFAKNMGEFNELLKTNPGFIKGMWCGNRECEDKIKEETGATLRNIPFVSDESPSHECVYCGKDSHQLAYFARAY